MIGWILVAGYIACAVLTYGLVFASFTRNGLGDVQGGTVFGVLLAIYGPIGLAGYGVLALLGPQFRVWPAYRYRGKQLKW